MCTIVLLMTAACQNGLNQGRNRATIESSASLGTWRNLVSASLLGDALLGVSFAAVLEEQSDPRWDGSRRTLAALPFCSDGSVSRITDGALTWKSAIAYHGCSSGTATLNGKVAMSFSAATDSIHLRIDYQQLRLAQGNKAVVYNGATSFASGWLYADQRPTIPVLSWSLDLTVAEGEQRVAHLKMRAAGIYIVSDQLTIRYSGSWQQNGQSVVINSSPMTVRFSEKGCLAKLDNGDGIPVELPWFPVSFYGGTITLVTSPDGELQNWKFDRCRLSISRNGIAAGSYSPAEDSSLFVSSTGLIGTIPARQMMRLAFANSSIIHLLTRRWCSTPQICTRYRYDPLRDPAGAFWLRTGVFERVGEAGLFEYSSALLSEQVTSPSEQDVQSWAVTEATDIVSKAAAEKLFVTPLNISDGSLQFESTMALTAVTSVASVAPPTPAPQYSDGNQIVKNFGSMGRIYQLIGKILTRPVFVMKPPQPETAR